MQRQEFTKQWDKAKSLNRNRQYKEAIAIYEDLSVMIDDFENMFLRKDYSSDEHYTKQMHFEKAMFWGDFTASLCNDGHFEKAIQTSEKALCHKEKGNLSTLLYIMFNTGNIHLFAKNYEKAIEWYDKALYENEFNKIWLNENERADYFTNKAIALYFSAQYDEAEDYFLKAIKVLPSYKNFEPFYFLSQISHSKNEEKLKNKYQKMYVTRKGKISDEEFAQAIRFYPIKID